MNQRSHSAAPSENYRSSSLQRRGSLSPPEDLYQDYSGLTVHNRVQQRSQSRSATATPTGSPKKRQLPQVPQSSMSAGSSTTRMVLRDRYVRYRHFLFLMLSLSLWRDGFFSLLLSSV